MDRIDLFRIFLRVVECASFTRAADTLGLPRSSVSTAIIDLEIRVGTRLLNRTTRKVSPTRDGTAFYERCQRLIADMEETETLFRRNEASPTGILRVDLPGRIGRLIVAPSLPEFFERYPNLKIELGVTDRAVDLIEDRTDCVLRVGPVTDSRLIAKSFGELDLINVASPAYLEQYGTPQMPDDLTHHFAVGYASPSSGRLEDWEWMADGKTRARSLPSRVTVNNAETYIACCLAGLGLIQIPAYDVQHHIKAKELVAVMPDFRAPPLPLTLLYPHRQHLSRRLQVFINWLEMLLRRTSIMGTTPPQTH